MQIVEALGDVNVLDAAGAPIYRLGQEQHWALYDEEAGRALRDGAVRVIESLDRRLAPYDGEPLTNERLWLPFIGRAGDALVTAACVQALKERYPAVEVDVACCPAATEVFALTDAFRQVQAYPGSAAALALYDYYLDFEPLEAVPRGARRSLSDLFRTCLRTPKPVIPARVEVPRACRERWADLLGGERCAGIHVGRSDGLRTYPHTLAAELSRSLMADGWRVVLVGTDDSVSPDAVEWPAGVVDLVGKTPTAADLAAVLSHLELFLAGDSFPLHLAGALGIPTVAIFTTTDAVIGSDYPSVTQVQSGAECSPCLTVGAECPLGHSTCLAHLDEHVAPEELTEVGRRLVEKIHAPSVRALSVWSRLH